MKSTTMAAIAGILGGALLLFGGGDGGGFSPTNDVLSDCHRSDRLSKTAILFEMAEKNFASDDAQTDWWNGQIEEARSADFQPFVDAVAVAIEAGKVKQLAEQLEVSR